MPAGADQATLGPYFLLAGMLISLANAMIGRGIRGRFAVRWLTLCLMTWVAWGVNSAL